MPSDEVARASRSRGLGGRVARYAAGSVVATVCSEVAFLLLYGSLGAAPAVASVGGWLAGAVPNYWLNRSWTWQRRDRPSLTRELAPYAAIVLVTLGLAALATTAADRVFAAAGVSSHARLVLVGGTFLAVYGAVFVLRFVLFDRLFRVPGTVASEERA